MPTIIGLTNAHSRVADADLRVHDLAFGRIVAHDFPAIEGALYKINKARSTGQSERDRNRIQSILSDDGLAAEIRRDAPRVSGGIFDTTKPVTIVLNDLQHRFRACFESAGVRLIRIRNI